jgi:hypothetical protein
MRRLTLYGAVLIAATMTIPARARAQGGTDSPAVQKGVAYLRSAVANMTVGEAAIAAVAMKKAHVENNDPGIQACLAKILSRFGAQGYIPEKQGGVDIYEAAVTCMALAHIEYVQYRPQIDQVAKYLLGLQKANGSWDYNDRTAGDTSMTQYALLGLWEADGAGIEVPPRVWDVAARWYMSKQYSDGSWNYHPDEPRWIPTVSMTAAGVGSILLCKLQLDRFRKGAEVLNPLLVPLTVEGGTPHYRIESSSAAMNSAANRGIAWLSRNFTPSESETIGQSAYYGLYGLERVEGFCESLKQQDMMRGFNWRDRSLQFVVSTQKGDGSWNGRQHGIVPNTAWAILFFTKSTAERARIIEIRRLQAGTLLGGRGLPSDLNNMTIAQGRVVVRPMNGAIDSMVAELEDPRGENADAALAGLIERYQAQGPTSLRPFKDRFRKLLTDRDPGIRRVACWALGRTAELDVVPNLVRAILDADESVVAEARVGLQVLSRRLDSLGPPRGANAEQKLEAAKRWRDWYESVRPPELPPIDESIFIVRPGPKQAAGAAPAPARSTASAEESR